MVGTPGRGAELATILEACGNRDLAGLTTKRASEERSLKLKTVAQADTPEGQALVFDTDLAFTLGVKRGLEYGLMLDKTGQQRAALCRIVELAAEHYLAQ